MRNIKNVWAKCNFAIININRKKIFLNSVIRISAYDVQILILTLICNLILIGFCQPDLLIKSLLTKPYYAYAGRDSDNVSVIMAIFERY